jgi:hypothetical protein
MKRYIAIDMQKMKEFELSMLEWALLENIYFLSNNDYKACYASKKALADYLGVTERHVFSLVDELTSKGFLVKTELKHLKVTEKWVNISSIDYEKSSYDNNAEGMKKVQSDYEKSSYKDRDIRENKENIIHSEAKASSFIISTPPCEKIILKPITSFAKCSKCKRKAKFSISNKPFCGQHTRIRLAEIGQLDAFKHYDFSDENQVVTKNSTLSKIETVQLPNFIDPHVWSDWVQHRKEIKHPLTSISIRKQLKLLERLHNEGEDANEIILRSITNGYQGLFSNRQWNKPKETAHAKNMSAVDAFFQKYGQKIPQIDGKVLG